MTIEDLNDVPWARCDWQGGIEALDPDVDTSDPWPDCKGYDRTVPANVLRVVECGTTPPGDWDGSCYGVVELTDGRFVAWETMWGPTGSGFCQDAYGGGANIGIASTEASALAYISARARDDVRQGKEGDS